MQHATRCAEPGADNRIAHPHGDVIQYHPNHQFYLTSQGVHPAHFVYCHGQDKYLVSVSIAVIEHETTVVHLSLRRG